MKTEGLVDTSVWIDHFNSFSSRVESLVVRGEALCHPMVLGELACGNLRTRSTTMRWLSEVKAAPVAGHEEVLAMLESLELFGRGLGWVDAHVIASALLSGTRLYTHDKRVMAVAAQLGILAAG
jgi:hypothetical protein